MEDLKTALADFGGIARLFPLPNLVMFPDVVQPLHIFEPRYREMTADALAGDHMIAMVLLREGWHQNYDCTPNIHPAACLGRIVRDQLLPDGRYNLLLEGLVRIRILDELPRVRLYREANVELIDDAVDLDTDDLTRLRNRLAEAMLPQTSDQPLHRHLSELFHSDLPLGAVCNILAFVTPLPLLLKQQLLETDSVQLRGTLLLHHLEMRLKECQLRSKGDGFPPDFSAN